MSADGQRVVFSARPDDRTNYPFLSELYLYERASGQLTRLTDNLAPERGPQCIPQIISFSLYRFEMNFRDATVLGLVGAGGIGYYINLYVRGFQYNKVAVLLIVIVLVVTILDQITFWILKKVQ